MLLIIERSGDLRITLHQEKLNRELLSVISGSFRTKLPTKELKTRPSHLAPSPSELFEQFKRDG